MDGNQIAETDCGCRKKSDRYMTFEGIECEAGARRVMASIERNVAASQQDAPFWAYFMAKRTPRSGPAPDALFLVHSHINQIREFFEECGDAAALETLLQLEEECC